MSDGVKAGLLRVPAGLRVQVMHRRRLVTAPSYMRVQGAVRADWRSWRGDTATRFVLSPRGGETLVRLVDAAGVCRARGLARCREDDLYVRKEGRELALARALESLQR